MTFNLNFEPHPEDHLTLNLPREDVTVNYQFRRPTGGSLSARSRVGDSNAGPLYLLCFIFCFALYFYV